MTNILDQKHFIFDFKWMFQRLNVTINYIEHYFDSEGLSIKDGVQEGRQLGF